MYTHTTLHKDTKTWIYLST